METKQKEITNKKQTRNQGNLKQEINKENQQKQKLFFYENSVKLINFLPS